MLKHIKTVCISMVIVVCMSGALHAKTASTIFENVSSSIVVIQTYDALGITSGFGSGVVISRGVVATNYHVIDAAATITVRYKGREYPASVLHADQDRDVCSLTVAGLAAPAVTLGSTGTLKTGARVYAVGSPQGLDLSLSDGIISSLRKIENGQHLLQITTPISPGSSGGGLFDEHSRLVGLPTFYLADAQQLNFAIPVEWISELPQRQKEIKKSPEPDAQEIRLVQAHVFVLLEDWAGLLNHALQWTKAHPADCIAWYCLGTAYGQAGQIAQARDAFQKALRIHPEYAEAWAGLGLTFGESGQPVKAIHAFQQALRINPEWAEMWTNLGTAYYDSGQMAQAIIAFKQALRINSDLLEAWCKVGFALVESDQAEQAIIAFQQALRLNPELADVWVVLGIAYAISGQQDKLMDVYKEIKELDAAKADEFFNTVVL